MRGAACMSLCLTASSLLDHASRRRQAFWFRSALLTPPFLPCNRRTDLEKRLQGDRTIPDEMKSRQLAQLGRTESSFLRLRRTRLGLDDFRTVKVIGKGAFGEVSYTHRARSVVLPSEADSPSSSRRFGSCRRSTPERSTP